MLVFEMIVLKSNVIVEPFLRNDLRRRGGGVQTTSSEVPVEILNGETQLSIPNEPKKKMVPVSISQSQTPSLAPRSASL